VHDFIVELQLVRRDLAVIRQELVEAAFPRGLCRRADAAMNSSSRGLRAGEDPFKRFRLDLAAQVCLECLLMLRELRDLVVDLDELIVQRRVVCARGVGVPREVRGEMRYRRLRARLRELARDCRCEGGRVAAGSAYARVLSSDWTRPQIARTAAAETITRSVRLIES
jgi:hypothetical protein